MYESIRLRHLGRKPQLQQTPHDVEDFSGVHVGTISATPELARTRSTEGGILVTAQEQGWDLIFPFFAHATPSGPLTSECFETLTGQLIEQLERAGGVNGVLLALHGAMYSERYPDCEGEILERVRRLVGPATPIALSLDLHANFTDRMAQLANIATTFRTTPHTDQREKSYRAACLLDDAMRRQPLPKSLRSAAANAGGFRYGKNDRSARTYESTVARSTAN